MDLKWTSKIGHIENIFHFCAIISKNAFKIRVWITSTIFWWNNWWFQRTQSCEILVSSGFLRRQKWNSEDACILTASFPPIFSLCHNFQMTKFHKKKVKSKASRIWLNTRISKVVCLLPKVNFLEIAQFFWGFWPPHN